MHIWNQPWPFIYEHHNRVPMLLSVTFDEIATLVWNFYWAHKFVARWIRYSCVYFYLWPFRLVAVSVCGRSGLWPFRSVAVSVCGRFGLWPFRSVAVPVCGRFGLWPFRFWPFRFVAVMTRILGDVYSLYALAVPRYVRWAINQLGFRHSFQVKYGNKNASWESIIAAKTLLKLFFLKMLTEWSIFCAYIYI